ncbi:MAG TPA: hypothetical protein VJ783_11180 [Pirellulales bacterium]|nr:hypothetical protein [Pirellulales bacterium]
MNSNQTIWTSEIARGRLPVIDGWFDGDPTQAIERPKTIKSG